MGRGDSPRRVRDQVSQRSLGDAGDSFSRNPKDRGRLLEARTRDLQGMSGRLRGFDLDQYLGEGTEGAGPVSWAVGSDGVPDTADRAPVAVPVAVTTEVPVRVMVVFDYLHWSEQDAALVEVQSAFQRTSQGGLVISDWRA